MTKPSETEQLDYCQNCSRKIKYFGPTGYMCPGCQYKEKNKDERKENK